jgi:fructosamine-3-kinase
MLDTLQPARFRSQELTECAKNIIADPKSSSILHAFMPDLKPGDVSYVNSGNVSIVLGINDYVVKIIQDPEFYWSEVAGLRWAEVSKDVNVPHVYQYGYDTVHDVYLSVMDRISLPNFEEISAIQGFKPEWGRLFAQELAALHRINFTERLGDFGKHSFVAKDKLTENVQRVQLYKKYLAKEGYGDYCIQHQLISLDGFLEIFELIRTLPMSKKASLVHGDYHPGNAFLNEAENRLTLFDFNSYIGDPMVDVATFANVLSIQGHEVARDAFLQEYKVLTDATDERINAFRALDLVSWICRSHLKGKLDLLKQTSSLFKDLTEK